jgi:DUF4097 and DUF4098 domain-containing protein YvlB
MQNTSFTVEAGSHLRVHSYNGSLAIHGWEEAYIAFEGSPSTAIEKDGNIFSLQSQQGDVVLYVPSHLAVSISEHTGDINVQNVRSLAVAVAKGHVAAESISENVQLRDVLGQVNVSRANALTIERDTQRKFWWHSITQPVFRSIYVDNTAVIVIAEARSDLRINNAQHAEIHAVGGDAEVHGIGGSLRIDAVGGNATLTNIAQLNLGSVGGNAHLEAIGSVSRIDNVGGNLFLQTQQVAANRNLNTSIGGNATLVVPDEIDLNIRAIFGGALYHANEHINLKAMAHIAYGNGLAPVHLTIGGDLYLQGGAPQFRSMFGSGRAASRAPRPNARQMPVQLTEVDHARSTILHLVANGQLSPDEAERQLEALEYAR